jgi:hypothetical protein
LWIENPEQESIYKAFVDLTVNNHLTPNHEDDNSVSMKNESESDFNNENAQMKIAAPKS